MREVFLRQLTENLSIFCLISSIIVGLGGAELHRIYVLSGMVPPEACNFMKKETLAQVLSCEFCEISKNTFHYTTPLVAPSSEFCHSRWNPIDSETQKRKFDVIKCYNFLNRTRWSCTLILVPKFIRGRKNFFNGRMRYHVEKFDFWLEYPMVYAFKKVCFHVLGRGQFSTILCLKCWISKIFKLYDSTFCCKFNTDCRKTCCHRGKIKFKEIMLLVSYPWIERQSQINKTKKDLYIKLT